MTTDEQRIAIAQACGWKHNGLGTKDSLHHPTDCQCFSGPGCRLPDYLNDLNAMHEAENQLTEAEWVRYALKLEIIVGEAMLADYSPSYVIRATASQRAEAFLRTLNLYTL